MVNESYYKLLEIEPGASPEEVKRSYYALAKKNHPDLFPEKERHVKEHAMMKINRAYMMILSHIGDGDNGGPEKEEPTVTENYKESPAGNSFQVGQLKDPAYAYYKLGFDCYVEGQRVFHSRFFLKEYKRVKNIFLGKNDLLKLALAAIENFEKAYSYFLKVVDEYPDSIWTSDANTKLRQLSNINRNYQKICENISTNL